MMGFAASVDALRSTSECISETRESGNVCWGEKRKRKQASNEILNSAALACMLRFSTTGNSSFSYFPYLIFLLTLAPQLSSSAARSLSLPFDIYRRAHLEPQSPSIPWRTLSNSFSHNLPTTSVPPSPARSSSSRPATWSPSRDSRTLMSAMF